MAFNSSMPMFWGDYLRDTGHLSAAEHGAYLMLIAHQWNTSRPIPDDDAQLAKIARMTAREWRAARRVLEGFFTVLGGYWSQKRVAIELERAAELYRQRQKGGVASGEKRRSIKQSTEQSSSSPPKSVQRQHTTVRQVPEPEPPPKPQEEIGGDGSAGANVRRETDLGHVVGDTVLEIMGVKGDARWLGNYSMVRAWLTSGFYPELDIYPTVRRLMAAKMDGPPKSLKYFTDAIARAHHDRTTALEWTIDDLKRGNHGQRPDAPKYRNGFAQFIAESQGETGDPGGLGGQADVVDAGDL